MAKAKRISGSNYLDRVTVEIMRKIRGWTRKEEMEADFRDHPEEHQAEMDWLRDKLVKVQKQAISKGGDYYDGR